MSKLLVYGLLVIVLIGSVFLFFQFKSSSESNSTTSNLPINNGAGIGSNSIQYQTQHSTISTGSNISIYDVNNSSISTRNFFQDKDTTKDSVNPNSYFLGQHAAEDNVNDPTAITDPYYTIQYQSRTNYFNIVLLKEPLRQSREMAEQYLLQKLSISQSQACGLRYMVSTPAWVSDYYNGTDLKFSFCPGAVQLP